MSTGDIIGRGGLCPRGGTAGPASPSLPAAGARLPRPVSPHLGREPLALGEIREPGESEEGETPLVPPAARTGVRDGFPG